MARTMHLRVNMFTRILVPLVGGVLALTIAMLGACGAHTTSPGVADARTSIYGARPSATLIPSDFSRGGASRVGPTRGERERMGEEELATYMKPESRAKPARWRAAPEPPTVPAPPEPLPALPRLPPVARPSDLAGPTEEPSAAPVVAQRSAHPIVPESTAPDMQRYAQREQRASGLSDFRGGEVVVISVTTLAIVLVIVLLVVLLT